MSLAGRAERWRTPSGSENDGGTHAALHARSRLRLKDQSFHWSTPRANERDQRDSRDATVALSRLAKAWPTPDASPERTDFHAGSEPASQESLSQAATRWQTPRAVYSNHPGMATGEHLTRQAIELWATPTSHDPKDGEGGGLPTKALLSRQAPRSGLPVPASGTSGPGSSVGGPSSRPRLSSAFVAWLMGFPSPHWAEPRALTSSEATEMRSSLSRQRSLFESLCGGWETDDPRPRD